MKKTKTQKGITLVALIITIIVLLILAVVAINAVQNDGIIEYAKNARDEYEKAQDNEKDILEYYESYLSGTVGQWKQEGSTLTKTNSDGTKTQVKIGDYVNYNEGSYKHTPELAKGTGTSYAEGDKNTGFTLATSEVTTEDLSWRVLGINERGEIELISADPTTQKLNLVNEEGYENAEDNLNNFCNDLYGQGTNNEGKKVATGARSLKVKDIDNLTKYNPTTYDKYRNKWTYKYPTNEEVSASTTGLTKNMWYRTDKADGSVVKDWSNITNESYQTFRLPNEETVISSSNSGSKELEHTFYIYSISSNLTTEDGFTADEATEISNMITKGTSNTNINYALSTRGVACDERYASFGLFIVYKDEVNFSCTYYSNGTFRSCGFCSAPGGYFVC